MPTSQAGASAKPDEIPGDTGPFAPANCNKPAKWVTSHHTISLHGQTIGYTATVGFLPLKDEQGAIKANMFFVAYTKDGDDASRPLTFSFNGGPGSSSLWLHIGALGPRRVALDEHGLNLPKPPYHMVDNDETWLPATDIVMLDTVNTGFSRSTTPNDSTFYGKEGDLDGLTQGIVQYMTWEKRWKSPIYVAGESYGGFRVGGLSSHLLDAGVALSGVISMSGVLNMDILDTKKDDDRNYLSSLPSMAAIAWYHKKLSPSLEEAGLDAVIKKAEAFDMGPYAAALVQGTMSVEKEHKIATEMSNLIGLPADYIERSNLRIPAFAFTSRLMQDEGKNLGQYDGRVMADAGGGRGFFGGFDASEAAISPAFTTCINSYLRDDLGFKSDARYRVEITPFPWDYNGGADTSDDLRQAMTQDPHMRVLFCCSYYDLVCPYMGMRYVVDHMGLPRDLQGHYQFTYYPSGHMIYTDTPSRQLLTTNVSNFIDATK